MNNRFPPNRMSVSLFSAVGIASLFTVVLGSLLYVAVKPQYPEMSFLDLVSHVKNNEVDSLTYEGDSDIYASVKVVGSKKMQYHIVGDTKSSTYQKLFFDHGLVPIYKTQSQLYGSLAVFGAFVMSLMFLGVVWSVIRSGLSVGGNASMSQASAVGDLRLTGGQGPTGVTFEDVAGVDEAKADLMEIVTFLKYPERFTALGGILPKGVLLSGSPGCGKTLLGRATAGEAGVPFYRISGSDFVEMYVGVGARRVRQLFEQARRNTPCIVFIDEIDSVGRHRSTGNGGSDERDQTLNQLLVEMDGFDADSGIIVIGATNRPDILDPALFRSGRFDRRIYVNLPDVKGREEILRAHSSSRKLSSSINFSSIAKTTVGLSGADLANIVNEAAIMAARSNKTEIDMSDFEHAKDRVTIGTERRSMVISDDEKYITAVHEAGHTLISVYVEGLDPVRKVSIIPRGQALGITQTQPERDVLSMSKAKAMKTIMMLMGGRVAEELVFKHITTGASNDIEKATNFARRMVCEWGMSDKLGPIQIRTNQYHTGDITSQSMSQIVDEEVQRIVSQCHDDARRVIEGKRTELELLAKALIEKETLYSDDIARLMQSPTK
jgi:cell division protease FtsH